MSSPAITNEPFCPEPLQMEHEGRITRLETTVSAHDNLIIGLDNKMSTVADNILQIKWFAMGAGLLYLAAELGVMESVRMYFGV